MKIESLQKNTIFTKKHVIAFIEICIVASFVIFLFSEFSIVRKNSEIGIEQYQNIVFIAERNPLIAKELKALIENNGKVTFGQYDNLLNQAELLKEQQDKKFWKDSILHLNKEK